MSRQHRTHWAIAAFVVTIALGAAACGGPGPSDVTLIAGPTAGSPTPPTVAVDDKTAAQQIVVSPLDLPGYEVAPAREADPATVQAATTFQNCAGANAALGDEEHMASSPGYRKGVATGVSSIAVVAPDEAQARTALGELAQPTMASCLTDLFRVVLQPELTTPITSASTTALPGSKVGDESVTWRTTLQLSNSTQKAYSDLTFIRSGRSIGSLFVYQVGDPFPTKERERLATAMAARMAVTP